MKVDPFTAMLTPMQVIMNDLEMMGLENKYGTKQTENTNANKKGRINAIPQQ